MRLPGFTADAVMAGGARAHHAGPGLGRPADGMARPQQPAPLPGCWFAGTSCYGFVQTLKFCCGDGTEYTQRWGWCIGLWFAPPCR